MELIGKLILEALKNVEEKLNEAVREKNALEEQLNALISAWVEEFCWEGYEGAWECEIISEWEHWWTWGFAKYLSVFEDFDWHWGWE